MCNQAKYCISYYLPNLYKIVLLFYLNSYDTFFISMQKSKQNEQKKYFINKIF